MIADIIALRRVDVLLDANKDAPPEDHELVRRIHEIQQLAIAEYLRRFPKTRNMNNHPWYETLLRDSANRYIGDRDIQCFFCRKSLNTIAGNRGFSAPFLRSIHRHTMECAVRMMAGLLQPHPPLKEGQPGL